MILILLSLMIACSYYSVCTYEQTLRDGTWWRRSIHVYYYYYTTRRCSMRRKGDIRDEK